MCEHELLRKTRPDFILNNLDGSVPLTHRLHLLMRKAGQAFADWLTATVPTLLDLILSKLVSRACICRRFNQILYLFHFEVATFDDKFILNKLQTSG